MEHIIYTQYTQQYLQYAAIVQVHIYRWYEASNLIYQLFIAGPLVRWKFWMTTSTGLHLCTMSIDVVTNTICDDIAYIRKTWHRGCLITINVPSDTTHPGLEYNNSSTKGIIIQSVRCLHWKNVWGSEIDKRIIPTGVKGNNNPTSWEGGKILVVHSPVVVQQ